MLRTLLLSSLCLCAALLPTACFKKKTPPTTAAAHVFKAPSIGLSMAQAKGWIQEITDPNHDGVVLKLVREASVPGSPRIDVTVEPAQNPPVTLDAFLHQNLQEMGLLDKNGDVVIQEVSQNKILLDTQEAYRVQYTYHVGSDPHTQVSITQWSLFTVVENKGVAITAAGRTELFHPVAADIEYLFSSVSFKRLH
jgi:hypothetical protein